jgi:hypothetical protein
MTNISKYSHDYLVYIIKSENLTYVGMTNNFLRRWLQHNRELSGGAKYTHKGKNWYPICISANSTVVKDKFKVVGVVIDGSHKKRKVEFVFDADDVTYSNKDTLHSDFAKK